MARIRKYVAYCKPPASLLGFSGSKVLVTLENKTNIQTPDLMDGVKLTEKKK